MDEDLRLGLMTGNGQDRPEKGSGYVAALVRATSPPCAPLLAAALLRATAERRGGEAAMASLLVGPDAFRIAPSSRLALTPFSPSSWPLPVTSPSLGPYGR